MSGRSICKFALILFPMLVPAQQTQIAGPVTGYVFDQAGHGVRPILGIPGASLLGSAVDFGFETASASIAPRQDAAFVTAADGSLHLFRIQSGAPAETSLNGLSPAAQKVVFSPIGTAAALYSSGSIQIISGLPDAPSVAAGLDVGRFPAPDSIALSDDGTALLFITGNSVELFNGAADQGKLLDTTGSALVAFAPGTHDAAVVDRSGAGILLFHNLGGSTDSVVLAAPDDTIQSSSAVAFSPDASRLLLANASGQSVSIFDLGAGTRSSIACSCAPAALVRVGDVFRLNELGPEPLWLLDARTATATLTFVPAAPNPVRRRPTRTSSPGRVFEPAEEPVRSPSRVQSIIPE